MVDEQGRALCPPARARMGQIACCPGCDPGSAKKLLLQGLVAADILLSALAMPCSKQETAPAVMDAGLSAAVCMAVCPRWTPSQDEDLACLNTALPCSGRKVAPVVVDEAALPEILREALRAARQQSVARRARRGGAGGADAAGGGDEEEEEDDEVTAPCCAPVARPGKPCVKSTGGFVAFTPVVLLGAKRCV